MIEPYLDSGITRMLAEKSAKTYIFVLGIANVMMRSKISGHVLYTASTAVPADFVADALDAGLTTLNACNL
jgi:hypothetical protein